MACRVVEVISKKAPSWSQAVPALLEAVEALASTSHPTSSSLCKKLGASWEILLEQLMSPPAWEAVREVRESRAPASRGDDGFKDLSGVATKGDSQFADAATAGTRKHQKTDFSIAGSRSSNSDGTKTEVSESCDAISEEDSVEISGLSCKSEKQRPVADSNASTSAHNEGKSYPNPAHSMTSLGDSSSGDSPAHPSTAKTLEPSDSIHSASKCQLSLSLAQICQDYSWEQLHCGHWKDVKLCWRQAYALAALAKALNLCLLGKGREALCELDKGILLGAPVLENSLQVIAGLLNQELTGDVGVSEADKDSIGAGDTDSYQRKSPKKIGKVVFKNYTPISDKSADVPRPVSPVPTAPPTPHLTCDLASVPLIDMARRIPVVYCPTLSQFHRGHMTLAVPVVVSGAMDHWPAYAHRKWSLSYLKRVAGFRTVPVELGSRYTDHEWSQKLMTISDFIDHHVTPPKVDSSEAPVKAYLAQHQLFDQIPELREDISIPDYCSLRTTQLNPENPPTFMKGKGRKRVHTGANTCTTAEEDGGSCSKEDMDITFDGLDRASNTAEACAGDRGVVTGDTAESCETGDTTETGDTAKSDGETETGETCDNVETGDGTSHVKINCWFGPMGTVSPLHFDPEHNLLAQVVGRKYIRLYSRDQTPCLYPHKGMLSNTSQVDVESPDTSAFPLFQGAEYSEFVLHPGQMLYIPPQCWHYVRSLDVSFSVSFWWF